ncbi:hypothetical protein D1872_294060 [compost metagenome]
MYSMVSYHTLNNETYFIKCMVLFERYRAYAVSETKAAYLEFIERVWIADVKKNGAIDCRS